MLGLPIFRQRNLCYEYIWSSSGMKTDELARIRLIGPVASTSVCSHKYDHYRAKALCRHASKTKVTEGEKSRYRDRSKYDTFYD